MQIIPVINCDDFQCVKDKIIKINEFVFNTVKATHIHIDIADGQYATEPKWNDPESLQEFVAKNNFAFNLSVHFMMKRPSVEIKRWSSFITKAAIPLDSDESAKELAELCRTINIIPCLSVPPSKTIKEALAYADYFNDFQILAVSPGPSGQIMSEGTLDKISTLRSALPSAILEVDGGVNSATAPAFKIAGADILLSGSYIFNSVEPKLAYLELNQLCNL